MNKVYLAIVLLTVYGDILKRYLPAAVALGSLYGSAFAILIWIIVSNSGRRKIKSLLNFEERQISNCIYFLIGVYVFEFLLASNNSPLIAGISTSMYVLLPLGYTLVIIKYCPYFNGVTLAQLYHLAMIPVNIIGLIQFKINPNFFIDNNYVKTGGIIARNLLEGGSFSRLPSIFTSADRYSSLGLVQFYLAFVLLLDNQPKSKFKIFWILFNILSGLTAMFISGARSRLLITITVFILLGFTIFMSFFSSQGKFKMKYLFKPIFELLLVVVFISVTIGLTSPEKFSSLGQEINNFPVLGFLQQSVEKGDIQGRVNQSVQISLIPEEVSLFGEGLGSLGNKPREFGISALWIESGLFWGLPKLAAFAGIILTFIRLAFRAFMKIKPVRVVLFCIPPLVLSFGLLTGLTGVLELSSGVLLCVCMGFVINFSRQSYNNHISSVSLTL
jgi:hypothetical protein